MITTLFGTDGIRGKAGEGIFTPSQLIRLGHALGKWLHEKYSATRVLMIHDTRISASIIKSALKIGLLESSINILDGFVLPTPAALFIMRELSDIDIAIVISASHNPYQDNGIKIVEKTTGTISIEDEFIISQYFHHASCTTRGWGIDTPYLMSTELYCEALLKQFPGNWARGIRVILDNAHGATAHIAHTLFTRCGADVLNLHAQPNGYNINARAGSTHPEFIAQLMQTAQADIGFAFDGDGDRVIAINRRGIIKNGDDILCILQSHARYQEAATVVGTVMTNEGLAAHLRARNKTLLRTSVGSRHMITALTENKVSLGGEPIGHIILHDQLPLGDALLNALTLLETVIATNNWDLDSFHAYPQVLTNIPIQQRFDLSQDPCGSLIQRYTTQLSAGRILVRYSGTENILRVMVEAPTHATAQLVSAELVHDLKRLFADNGICNDQRLLTASDMKLHQEQKL
jgi:phosphoglucosamine mutase